MRTDVKIGLICVFAIVLAVVIYFVAQGNAKPREAKADNTVLTPRPSPTTAPSAAPAADPTSLIASAPFASPPVAAAATPTSPSTPMTSMQLAQADSFHGGPIPPPSAPGSAIVPPGSGSSSLSAPPSTPSTPSTPTFSSPTSTPLSGGTSIIPAAPGAASTTRPAFGMSEPTIEPAPRGSSSRDTSSHMTPLPAPGTSTPPAGLRSNFGTRTPGSSGTTSVVYGNVVLGNSSGNTYTIQKGDILTTIAKKNNTTVKAIEAANPGIDPNHLKVKQVINLPAAGTSTPGTSIAAVGGSSSATTRPSASGSRSSSSSTSSSTATRSLKPGSSYTIKKGDSLQTIAQAAYGNKTAWKRIFRANRSELGDANTIPVGTTIRLPE